MKGVKNLKKIKAATLAVSSVMLCYILFLFTNPLYNDADSIEVATVVGGLYGEDNFCQYLHPFLCLMIRPINHLLPRTDVFTTIIHLAVFCTLCTLVWLGGRSLWMIPLRKWMLPDWLQAGLVGLALLFLSAGIVIWNANYTVQTAFFIFAGLILVALAKKRRGSALYLCGLAAVIFGFMLRIEAALLFLPFLALEILTELLEERKDRGYRDSLRKYLPIVLVIGVILSTRMLFYNMEPYRSAMRYNKARTTCVDYPMLSWSQISDRDNILQADYEAATSWVLLDTEIMNTALLERIAEQGNRDRFNLKRDGVQPVLKEMWRRLTQTNLYLFAFFVLSGILLVRNVLLIRSGLRTAKSILAALGGFIILFYFTMKGRAPLRIWEPVLFAVDYVLISAAIRTGKSIRNKTTEHAFQLLLCAVLWFSAGQVIAHTQLHVPATPINAKYNVDDSAFSATFESDGVFLWKGWMSTVPRYFMSKDKLPTQRVLEHNLPVGDWIYGQPYFEGWLERIGISNPAQALIKTDRVYVMSDSGAVINFLKAHYDSTLEYEFAGEICSTSAYRVVPTDNSQ